MKLVLSIVAAFLVFTVSVRADAAGLRRAAAAKQAHDHAAAQQRQLAAAQKKAKEQAAAKKKKDSSKDAPSTGEVAIPKDP